MDKQIQDQISTWKNNLTDETLLSELAELQNSGKEQELSDAFYRDTAFGTAGIRALLGVGTNRMNTQVVARVTQGLANYLNKNFDKPSVALARDSRRWGEDFQKITAEVLAANNIHVYIYSRIEPVPALSFAVRHLGCSAGIALTASHNPREYNGYKVYDNSGCQISGEVAAQISEEISRLDYFADIQRLDFEEALNKGLVEWTSDEVIDAFVAAVVGKGFTDIRPKDSFKVVYTPLNGTGIECVKKALTKLGITNIEVVPEQADPNPEFPTCPYPNPEFREALEVGLKLCDKVEPDLLLATDPDADRMGTAIPHKGSYKLLTGNEVAVLLMDWIASKLASAGEDVSQKVAVTSIVSTPMVDALARDHGFELRRVLTGFKYVGEQMDMLEDAGEDDRFMMGFEESYGYLVGTHVRDKDAVVASVLTVQMASYYADKGLDLYEALEQLYQKYGYYLNAVESISFPGESGAKKMSTLMEELRKNSPATIAGLKVEKRIDYAEPTPMMRVGGLQKEDEQTLPCSDVLEFCLEGAAKLIIRPSGTEPKVKCYLTAKAGSRKEAEELLEKLKTAGKELLS